MARSDRISKVVARTQRKAQPWPGQANPGAPRTGGAKNHPTLGPVNGGGQMFPGLGKRIGGSLKPRKPQR